MQCILCKIYFWKVFHKYYNFICAPICTKSFIFAKSGCYSMLLFVTLVRESSPSINDLQDCCSLCKYPGRSGKRVSMDFVVGLPRTQSRCDSLWLIMDQLTKVAHFITIKTPHTRPQLVELYVSRIVYFYGVS
jgi:hypothetical protein